MRDIALRELSPAVQRCQVEHTICPPEVQRCRVAHNLPSVSPVGVNALIRMRIE
jgi:hypothetical protein